MLLGLAYGLNMPLFEAPDEPGHYLFVRYLQAYRALPVQTEVFDAPRAHHPPLYFALAALASGWVRDLGDPDSIHMTPNPHFGYRPDDPYPDNKAVYLHNGPEERWPFAGQARAVYVIRLVSLAFSTLAVAATFGAALALRPGALGFAVLAAGLVAFNPMVLFMAGQVSNDTGALAGGAVTLWALSVFARRGWTPARWGLVGLALAAATLLKASGLLLAVPIGIALAGEWARAGRWADRLRAVLALGTPPLLLAGWWFWRNVQLYGDFSGNAAVGLVNGRVPEGQQWASLVEHLGWLWQGTVGCAPLGPFSACFPTWVYGVALGLTVLALAGAARLVWRRGWPAWGATTGRLWLAHGVLAAAVIGAVFVYALSFQNAWAGRLLFPAFTSLALVLAAGALAWAPTPRGRGLVVAGVLAALVALDGYGLVSIILPRYGVPRAPTAAEQQAMTPLDAQLGEAARVRGYQLEHVDADASGVVAVTVYWEPLAVTDRPYSVFIHVLNSDGQSLAQRDTYPGLGNWATTLWVPGRAFADTYRLFLPPDTSVPEGAFVVLGLYDEATGQRLPATGTDVDAAQNWVVLPLSAR